MAEFSVGDSTRTARWRRFRGCVLGALVAAVGLFSSETARSDDYPKRPVRIVLGFAAGGPTDSLSRIIGDQLSKSLGAPMVIENRLGAGGNIAASAVARSPADGYTLLVGGTNYVIGRSWYKNMQFDILKDFQIVSTILAESERSGRQSRLRHEDLERCAAEGEERTGPFHLRFVRRGHGRSSGWRDIQVGRKPGHPPCSIQWSNAGGNWI